MIKQFNLFKFVSSCVNFGIFSSVFFLHQIFLFILFSSLSFLAWYCQFNHWLINLCTFLIPASFSFFFFPISWSSSFSNVTPCHTSSFSFCFSSISPISPLLLLENCGHQESIRHLRCHVGVSTRTNVRVNVVCVYKSVCVFVCLCFVYNIAITFIYKYSSCLSQHNFKKSSFNSVTVTPLNKTPSISFINYTSLSLKCYFHPNYK